MSLASDDLCRRFGLEVPVFQAAMGWVSGGRLAAAVSNAGGLGVIATGGFIPPAELLEQIARVRDEAPGKPFGVNVLLPSGATQASPFGSEERVRALLDVCIEQRVPVVLSGLGDPSRVIPEMHAIGTMFVAVVGTTRAALKCAAAGADAVIVQGHEAGGHVGPTCTFPLAQQAIRSLAVPVVVAGGIATGDAVRAALSLGAAGVSVGTRFIASVEAECHDAYKQLVVGAGENATAVTRVATGKPNRAFRNAFVEQWVGRDSELKGFVEQAQEHFWRTKAGAVDGDVDSGFFPMGQCAVLVEEILPASAIVERLAAGAVARDA